MELFPVLPDPKEDPVFYKRCLIKADREVAEAEAHRFMTAQQVRYAQKVLDALTFLLAHYENEQEVGS